MAPQILEDIGDVAEDAVDFVEAFFDDPKHAITKLEGKFTSFAGDIVSKAKCLFRHCSDQDDHPGAQKLSSACANVQRPAPATVSAYPTTSSGDDGHSQPPASSYSTPTPSYDDGSYRQPSPPPSYGTPTVSITSYVPASSSLRPSVEAASPSSSSGTHNSGSGGGGGSVGSSGDAIVVNMAYMLAVPLLIVLLLGRKVLIW